jgi:ribosome-binding protein aMBF1 (putative translation factor)
MRHTVRAILHRKVIILIMNQRRVSMPTATDPQPVVHPIRAFRQRREWSQRKLGYLADLSESQISAIERGWLIPRPVQLKRLAKALGVKEEDLVP